MASRDYLGWSKAEIKAGRPIETAAERRAFRVPKPKIDRRREARLLGIRVARADLGRSGARHFVAFSGFAGAGKHPYISVRLTEQFYRGQSRAYQSASRLRSNYPGVGRNLGSFAHKKGSWKKGAGGRFVGSGG
jgi:hypothetical protein